MDLAVDQCLSQLPTIIKDESKYKNSTFFSEQLTAFQVWLAMGSVERKPPEQLPIVLQVGISKCHYFRMFAYRRFRLWHRCFPVTFVKFLRTPFLQNTAGQLLLWVTLSGIMYLKTLILFVDFACFL